MFEPACARRADLVGAGLCAEPSFSLRIFNFFMLAFGKMLKPHVIESSVRQLRNYLLYNYNSWRGREYIPDPRFRINIETSSICNLRCRFCAYVKKTTPKMIMPDGFFQNCVKQAAAMGFYHVGLTPMTGDVFCDPNLFDKFAFLESFDPIREYSFFTNLTLPTRDDIDRLLELRKLRELTVSLYGHDLASFTAITGRGEGVYRRLLENLEYLVSNLSKVSWRPGLGWRSYSTLRVKPDPALKRIFKICKAAGIRVSRSQVYNNWGGFVGRDDLGGLPIDINENASVYKKGACCMLLSSVQIMANGTVNGCSCRDVNGTLCIGDMNSAPLSGILTTSNPVYLGLIEAQQCGDFPEVCGNCDFYKSIYLAGRALQRAEGESITLREFMARY